MKHVMIDLETLGLHADCVILSIGAIEFDLDSGDIGNSLGRNVEIEDQLKRGRRITGDTLKFWLAQERDALDSCLRAAVPLESALYDFGEFLYDNEIKFIWANGVAFDIGILQNAFNSIPLPLPWAYYNVRDFKTLRELLEPPSTIIERRSEHNALADCKFQIQYLCAIWKQFQKIKTEKNGTTKK